MSRSLFAPTVSQAYQIAALMATLLLAACSPALKQEVVIPDKSGNVTTTVNVGGGSSPYPADFPLPQYPGSKVQLTQNETLTKGSGGTKTIMLASHDAADKISPFYKDWFNSNGYKILSEANVSGLINITAEKDNETIMVSACASPGPDNMQTAITLTRTAH